MKQVFKVEQQANTSLRLTVQQTACGSCRQCVGFIKREQTLAVAFDDCQTWVPGETVEVVLSIKFLGYIALLFLFPLLMLLGFASLAQVFAMDERMSIGFSLAGFFAAMIVLYLQRHTFNVISLIQ